MNHLFLKKKWLSLLIPPLGGIMDKSYIQYQTETS